MIYSAVWSGLLLPILNYINNKKIIKKYIELLLYKIQNYFNIPLKLQYKLKSKSGTSIITYLLVRLIITLTFGLAYPLLAFIIIIGIIIEIILRRIAIGRFVLFCFALLCFALLCFALLCLFSLFVFFVCLVGCLFVCLVGYFIIITFY